VVVAEHALVGCQVELVIVLREFTVRDGGVLVDDAADLHGGVLTHSLGVALELYYLDL